MSVLRYTAVVVFVFLAFFGVRTLRKVSSRSARVCTEEMFLNADEAVRKKMEAACPVELLEPIFKKPLFFLGKGKQCSAYESADGRYVVKFFKNAFKPKKQKKVQGSIEGGFIAWVYALEETGVIACSTGKNPVSLPPVTLLTKKGRIESIDLTHTPFLVQKKAEPFKQTLMRLVAKGESEKAQEAMLSVFELLARCRDKGLLDTDGSLIRKDNLGFMGGRAVLIDTGRLHLFADAKRQTLHDVKRLKPLGSWIEAACPELLSTYKSGCAIYGNFEG